MAGSTLLWWPTDPWVFREEPEAQAVFSVTRPIVAAFGFATAVGCRALGSHPRFAPWLLLAGGAPPAFFLGWSYSSLGGLDGVWFYFAYFFPLLSILALCPLAPGPLAPRVVVASGLSMAYPLAYFVRHPHYVEDGRFVISVSFFVFVVLVVVVIGHVIYRLVERQVEVQQELERRVAERTRELSRLSGHLTQSQETERRRVARDLHESFDAVDGGSVDDYVGTAVGDTPGAHLGVLPPRRLEGRRVADGAVVDPELAIDRAGALYVAQGVRDRGPVFTTRCASAPDDALDDAPLGAVFGVDAAGGCGASALCAVAQPPSMVERKTSSLPPWK